MDGGCGFDCVGGVGAGVDGVDGTVEAEGVEIGEPEGGEPDAATGGRGLGAEPRGLDLGRRPCPTAGLRVANFLDLRFGEQRAGCRLARRAADRRGWVPVQRGRREAGRIRPAAGVEAGARCDKGAAADPGAMQVATATDTSSVQRTPRMRVYVARGCPVGQPPCRDWTNLWAQTLSSSRRGQKARRQLASRREVGAGGPLDLP